MAEKIIEELNGLANVTILKRTTAMGYYDYNYLTALEKVTNHHVEFSSTLPRERYWRIRSKKLFWHKELLKDHLFLPTMIDLVS